MQVSRGNFLNWLHAVCGGFVAIIPLALTSCSNPDVLEENATAEPSRTRSADLPPLVLLEAEAKAISAYDRAASKQKALAASTGLARSAFQQVLFDPGSVQFLQLRAGRNGSACGKYNAKNRYGAYVGFKDFVVTKDKEAITSENNDGLSSLPGLYFASRYVADCATPKERSAYLAQTTPMNVEDDFSVVPDSDEYESPAVQDEPDAILDAPAGEPETREEPTT